MKINIELKEERRKNIERALGINALGGVEPSKEFMELLERYVEGEITMDEIRELIIAKYKKK